MSIVQFKSFTYSPSKSLQFEGKRVNLPGLGWMGFDKSRSFPAGFAIKSVKVRQKADGWYISVRLEDATVPAPPSANEIQTVIGIDVGIKKIVSLSNGETIVNPQVFNKRVSQDVFQFYPSDFKDD
ncbi:MAG: hypothetical protein AB4426_18915 [Xenococcaceae cyanobacterium]